MTKDRRYEIRIDLEQRLLRLTLSGYMDQASVLGYEREVDAAIERIAILDKGRRTFAGLIDIREQSIHSRDIAARFQERAGQYAERLQRVAVLISSSAILRMQVKRIVPDDNHAVFEDEHQAIAWLGLDAQSGAKRS